jgi:hypothetical protein
MTRVTYDGSFDDLDELRKRFEEFRNQHHRRARLPDELWRAAAEIAGRRGMNPVCRHLRLDANSLKKWMSRGVIEPGWEVHEEKTSGSGATGLFRRLLTPASGVAASCIIEVESHRGGKLGLEVKGIATSEIAQLIHSFAGQ